MARATLRAKSPTVITTPGAAHTARTDIAIAAAEDNNHFDLFMNSPLVAGPVPMRPFAESYVQIRTPSMNSCDSLRGNGCADPPGGEVQGASRTWKTASNASNDPNPKVGSLTLRGRSAAARRAV